MFAWFPTVCDGFGNTDSYLQGRQGFKIKAIRPFTPVSHVQCRREILTDYVLPRIC